MVEIPLTTANNTRKGCMQPDTTKPLAAWNSLSCSRIQYKMVPPPSYVCWLINHRSIDISTISHSEMEVMFINFAFTNWGTTCDVIVHKKLALVAGDESRPS